MNESTTNKMCISCKARLFVKNSEKKAIENGLDYGDWITDMAGEPLYYESDKECECE